MLLKLNNKHYYSHKLDIVLGGYRHGQEVNNKMAEENITWDDAISSGAFIKLKEGESKVLKITNWKLEKVDKFGAEQVELSADVLLEDGQQVEKEFSTTSNRLKSKLRPILEGKDKTGMITVSIIKVGDKFDTQYAVKEVKE